MSLSAALDVFCMTSPFSYLLPTVKSSREAIKIIFRGKKKLPYKIKPKSRCNEAGLHASLTCEKAGQLTTTHQL